ncbi:MAG: phosphatidate cytidylyltransferase [Proteobacteria bacterium]|nr:phosphatidate cytidylyltransferase [Pseudomonadota bacterium]
MQDIFAKAVANASAPVLWGIAGVDAILLVGTLAAVLLPILKPGKDYSNLRQRVWSWWIMIVLLSAALIAGWQTMAVLFAGVSFLALKEFLSLAPSRREDRLVILFAYLTVPVAYALVFLDMYEVYLVTIPVWFFLITPFLMTIGGQTRGYLATVATFSWGTITCVYNLGLLPFLARTPGWDAPQAGGAGLVFFLLFVTEANDVLQYVWGKLIGRRKIMPTVSPGKTWEGFLGGWVCTALLIYFLAPVFTPLKPMPAGLLALLLPLAGFAGDVTMSAIKRDLGVKDTSTFIPGHGGVLDRVDSLTFTAPLYFHILAYYALATY